MKSITLFKIALFSLLLATLVPAHAQNYTKITYVHSDADGTPFAATDSQGNVEWQIDHYPYGKEYSNTQVARKNNISFAGKPYDEEIGLSYFGGRWYDPDIGRFTGIDPMPVNPNDYRSFNRYSYGFNNPYKYVDPDGNFAFLIPVAIWAGQAMSVVGAGVTGYTVGTNGYQLYTGQKTTKEAAKDTAIGVAEGIALKGAGGQLTKYARKFVPKNLGPEIGGGADIKNLSPGQQKRIQNAADKSDANITVVGSQTTGINPGSDFDFILEGGTSRSRSRIKNSLPQGPRTTGDGSGRDFHEGPVDKSLPYITFKPKPKK